MGRSRPRKKPKGQMVMMGDIPINRPYAYEKRFFKESTSVLQGIQFPLKSKSFKSGKIKLGKSARKFGASSRGIDIRNISYPGAQE